MYLHPTSSLLPRSTMQRQLALCTSTAEIPSGKPRYQRSRQQQNSRHSRISGSDVAVVASSARQNSRHPDRAGRPAPAPAKHPNTSSRVELLIAGIVGNNLVEMAFSHAVSAASIGAAIGALKEDLGGSLSEAINESVRFVISNGPIIAIFGLLYNSNSQTKETLGGLKEAVDTLKRNGVKIEEALERLEQGQNDIKGTQKSLEERQASFEEGQALLINGQKTLSSKQDILQSQFGKLSAGQRRLRADVKKLIERMDGLEHRPRPWWPQRKR